MKIALIDLGTNSIRLFIYKQARKNSWRRVVKRKYMVRLGDNLFEHGSLDKEAVKRTVKAFINFSKELANHDIDSLEVVATSALRSARDREKLVERVAKKAGIEIDIISGKKEASLIALGVTRRLKLPDRPLVFIDIGGGSTEISLATGSEVLFSTSFEMGAARNQQLCLKNVPPAEKSIEKMREDIREMLSDRFSKFTDFSASLAIGTSGSLRAYRIMSTRAGGGENTFSRKFLQWQLAHMSCMTREQLRKIPTLEERRIDLIVSAGIILDEIMKFFSLEKVQVTSVALKDGMLESAVEKLAL